MLRMLFMLLIGLSKDGRWLQFSQVQLHLYMAMLRAMGLEWMLNDDEWKGAAFAQDQEKVGEFWDRLLEAVNEKTLAEWTAIFEKDHDVWAETMRRGPELLDHPQSGPAASHSTTKTIAETEAPGRATCCSHQRAKRGKGRVDSGAGVASLTLHLSGTYASGKRDHSLASSSARNIGA